eukprot:2723682-Rhodomonas_salina.3
MDQSDSKTGFIDSNRHTTTLGSGRERSMPTPTIFSGLQRTSLTVYSPSAHSSEPEPAPSAPHLAPKHVSTAQCRAHHGVGSGPDPRACP